MQAHKHLASRPARRRLVPCLVSLSLAIAFSTAQAESDDIFPLKRLLVLAERSQPQLHWALPDQMPTAGGSIRLLGRSLFVPGETTQVHLEGVRQPITLPCPKETDLLAMIRTASAQALEATEIELPPLPAGRHRLFVSRGSGDRRKQTEPIEITVADGPQSPPRDYLAAFFGASPNDGIDDSLALQLAIDQVASQGGGSLRLESGIYDISMGLVMREAGVRLIGPDPRLGKKRPTIRYTPTQTFPEPPLPLLTIGGSRCGIQDLDLVNDAGQIVLQVTGPGARHVDIIRTRLVVEATRAPRILSPQALSALLVDVPGDAFLRVVDTDLVSFGPGVQIGRRPHPGTAQPEEKTGFVVLSNVRYRPPVEIPSFIGKRWIGGEHIGLVAAHSGQIFMENCGFDVLRFGLH